MSVESITGTGVRGFFGVIGGKVGEGQSCEYSN